jgi:tetrahydromethanopterin S-methyltransferase subunit G
MSVQDTNVLSLLLVGSSLKIKCNSVSCWDMLLAEKLVKNEFHDLQEVTSSPWAVLFDRTSENTILVLETILANDDCRNAKRLVQYCSSVVGDDVGMLVGAFVGLAVFVVPCMRGLAVGCPLGLLLGFVVGCVVGWRMGCADGLRLGCDVGGDVGRDVGDPVG